jgi:beta-xylosidase
MTETDPVADFDTLAWAPHVIQAESKYHLFWSPHQLHQMESQDGIHWANHRITLPVPYHKFFRDPMVTQVAESQWLLYTTARGAYFSQIDIYQSFDLEHWQYIRTALRSAWGSERNAPFASMESPFVTGYQNHYYLTLTYNNDSFFWNAILLLFHIWLRPHTYNATLVFQATNPYDFGTYRGRRKSPTLLTRLEAHAPEIVHHPTTGQWYITTAGWPWVATLTAGEVACAPLTWRPIQNEHQVPNPQSSIRNLKS